MNKKYQYLVKFEHIDSRKSRIYTFTTYSQALNFFRPYYNPESEKFYKTICISEFDNIHDSEKICALLSFVERDINGNLIRKDWRNWKIGRPTIFETHEFDGDSLTQGIITEIHYDHAILKADGMNLWIDDDSQYMFR